MVQRNRRPRSTDPSHSIECSAPRDSDPPSLSGSGPSGIGRWTPPDAGRGGMQSLRPDLVGPERRFRPWLVRGPVGFSDLSGNGVYVVAIRSALLRGDRAWAFAGAGIVEASVAELEWDETDVKLKAVVEQLQTSRSRR